MAPVCSLSTGKADAGGLPGTQGHSYLYSEFQVSQRCNVSNHPKGEKKHERTIDMMVCKEGFFVNVVACLFFLYLGKMVGQFRAWTLELDLLRIYPQHDPCKY